MERVHGGFGDEERRGFPDSEDLRKAGAVVGVLVGDQDGVEMIDFAADSGQAGQGFAFAQTGIDEDARALCFQQREIAGTARSQNGDAQGDRNSPGKPRAAKTFQMMAEGRSSVNAQTTREWKIDGRDGRSDYG